MNKKLSPGRRAYTAGMKALMYASTAAMGALVLFLIGYVLYRGIPNITWEFLTTAPSILNDTIGIWPDILNSIYVVIATIIIVLPLGVCAAVYLSEYASNKKLVRVIEYAAETLSGIPSIIYGLVGMLFFCEFLKMQTSLMAGALTLVIMNLPTVMRTTQESLKTVPQSYREGAFGLGADYYLTKPFGVMELISCVKAVLRRCGAEDEKSTLNACGISMNTLEHTVSADGERITLTYKEYELLKLFLSHMGTAFTREQLMEQVWGTDYMGETRTIDMHIRTLRQKLGKCGESIKTVRNVGYRMEEWQ